MEDAVLTDDHSLFSYSKIHGGNQSSVTEVLILGFPTLNTFKVPLFIFILFIYSLTISENFLIVVLVSISHHLHSPMYFFLSHLAVTDIVFVTNIIPKALCIIIREGDTLTVLGCLTQFFLHGLTVSTECFLLTVMSGDRYLAICKPLHYVILMSKSLQYSLVICCWTLSSMMALITLVLAFQQDFCGPNVIDHFFCDFAPVQELSCSETPSLAVDMFALSIPIALLPFIFISGTYICISVAISKIPSLSGRQKAFSTCSSHLAVVCMYYGSMFIIYMLPYVWHSLTLSKFISLIYILFTPLLNPIIYSLRNQEIKSSLMSYKC